jgi:CHASE2 domain-containing sensor protein
LDGKIDPNLVKNRIVLIGVTAPVSNASGFFATPQTRWGQFYRDMSGVVVQAHAISQLISAALDDRPLLEVWNPWIEGFWVGSWAVLGGAIAVGSRRFWVWGLVTGVAAGGLVGVSLGLLVGGLWVPLVPTAVAVVATGAIGRSVLRKKQRI